MAYGGGIFLPSETAYKDPNRFRDVLQAEGNKEASYLADMDQFFAQLEEMKRQFNITAEMKDRQFEETLALEQSKLEQEVEENALNRSLKRYEIEQKSNLGYAQIKSKENIASQSTDIARAQLGLKEEAQRYNISTNEFMKNLYLDEANQAKESHNTLINKLGGSGGTTSSSGVSGVSDSYYNPFNPNQSISDFLGGVESSSNIEDSYKQYGDWY